MFTDGAVTNPDGTLLAIQSKVWTVAEGAGAISIRGGLGPWVDWLLAEINGARTMDDVVQCLTSTCRILHDLGMAMWPGLNDQDRCLEVTLIGWFEARRQAEAWMMTSDPEVSGGDGVQAFEMQRLDSPRGAPVVPSVLATLGLPASPCWSDIDALDPDQSAIAWVSAQRHSIEGWPFPCVGGFVEVTTATPAGVVRRIIRRWDDEIGELLKP